MTMRNPQPWTMTCRSSSLPTRLKNHGSPPSRSIHLPVTSFYVQTKRQSWCKEKLVIKNVILLRKRFDHWILLFILQDPLS